MYEIDDRYEDERGCGFRQPGGLYLCADGPCASCPKLPIPLTVCPTCHGGIKPTRAWTWIDADPIVRPGPHGDLHHDLICPLAVESLGRCGLLWIGEKFYPTPADWTRETLQQGVSRRIPHVPKELEIGQTLVLVAHRKAIKDTCLSCHDGVDDRGGRECEDCNGDGIRWAAGLFHAFRPQRVEYVVTGAESDEELQRRADAGQTLVRVHPQAEPEPVPLTVEETP